MTAAWLHRTTSRDLVALLRPSALRVTIPPAILVGSTLTAIHHFWGDAAPPWLLTVLTFAVPWMNASYGFSRARPTGQAALIATNEGTNR